MHGLEVKYEARSTTVHVLQCFMFILHTFTGLTRFAPLQKLKILRFNVHLYFAKLGFSEIAKIS